MTEHCLMAFCDVNNNQTWPTCWRNCVTLISVFHKQTCGNGVQDRHSSPLFFIECMNSVLSVLFQSSTVLDSFFTILISALVVTWNSFYIPTWRILFFWCAVLVKANSFVFWSLFHTHTHKYANYSTYWFPSGMYLHNWLIHVHAIWSSIYMYMSQVGYLKLLISRSILSVPWTLR